MSHLDPKAKGSIAVGRGNGFQFEAVGADTDVLTADSAQATGVKYAPLVPSGQLPLWLFGNGMDGSLTLVADTTLTSADKVLHYVNLDLAGFTLETALYAVSGILIYVQNTLTLGGGTIRGGQANSPTSGGTAGGPTAGAGGGQATGRDYIWVFARTIVGTGLIHSNGFNGGDGGDASANPAGARAFGTDGGVGSDYYLVCAYNQVQELFVPPLTVAPLGATPGAGYTGGLGGTPASAGVTTKVPTFNARDFDWTTVSAHAPYGGGSGSLLYYGRGFGTGQSAATGGGGNEAEGGTEKDGEAGAGGGAGGDGFGDGGVGGDGGDGNGHSATAGDGASGPGGGSGGAGGGFVCVVTNSAPGTLTVSANGGDGGKGGNGVDAGGGTPRRSGGGGGGGGGAGGMAVLIAQTGNGATVTATAGSGGAGGTAGGSGATAGAAGTAADDGYVVSTVYA